MKSAVIGVKLVLCCVVTFLLSDVAVEAHFPESLDLHHCVVISLRHGGNISPQKLGQVFSDILETTYTEEELQDMVEAADEDNDGLLNGSELYEVISAHFGRMETTPADKYRKVLKAVFNIYSVSYPRLFLTRGELYNALKTFPTLKQDQEILDFVRSKTANPRPRSNLPRLDFKGFERAVSEYRISTVQEARQEA